MWFKKREHGFQNDTRRFTVQTRCQQEYLSFKKHFKQYIQELYVCCSTPRNHRFETGFKMKRCGSTGFKMTPVVSLYRPGVSRNIYPLKNILNNIYKSYTYAAVLLETIDSKRVSKWNAVGARVSKWHPSFQCKYQISAELFIWIYHVILEAF
jgi:hypothetical protein